MKTIDNDKQKSKNFSTVDMFVATFLWLATLPVAIWKGVFSVLSTCGVYRDRNTALDVKRGGIRIDA